MTPAAPWETELYAGDLDHYEAASSAHRQRMKAHMRKFDMRFQPSTKSLKDLESRGVECYPKEMWYNICVVECVLSMDPRNLFGNELLGIDPNVSYDKLSSDESAVDANTTAKASGTTTRAAQPQPKGPGGKSVTSGPTSVTPGLLVAPPAQALQSQAQLPRSGVDLGPLTQRQRRRL